MSPWIGYITDVSLIQYVVADHISYYIDLLYRSNQSH